MFILFDITDPIDSWGSNGYTKGTQFWRPVLEPDLVCMTREGAQSIADEHGPEGAWIVVDLEEAQTIEALRNL